MKKLLIALVLTLSLSLVSAKSFVDEVTNIVGQGPEVNINLGTGIINTILALSNDDEAKDMRKIMAGLEKIRVSVFELKGNKNTAKLGKLIKSKVDGLLKQGYESIVTVRDGDETVNIIAKVKDQKLEDAMLIVMEEGDELVVISMEGILDLVQLAEISDHFDVDLKDIAFN